MPGMEQHIFKISYCPSHPSRVTKHSSLELAEAGITSLSMAQKGYKSYIGAYLVLQELN